MKGVSFLLLLWLLFVLFIENDAFNRVGRVGTVGILYQKSFFRKDQVKIYQRWTLYCQRDECLDRFNTVAASSPSVDASINVVDNSKFKTSSKELFARYGAAYLSTSVTLSLCTFTLCYIAVANGIDVAKLLTRFRIQPTEAAVSASNLGLAYAAHKALSPVRFIPTVILTPFVAQWMGKCAP
jgi:hypothetical protein